MQTEPLKKAGRILDAGGVVAYPTEGVYGLGCLPECLEAVARILAMKRRDPGKGLLLIGSRIEQLEPWIDLEDAAKKLAPRADRPITWVVPASADAPFWITGDNPGVAVRITTHPVASALCDAARSALVSTSANRAGRPPARTAFVLRRHFRGLVDYIVPGQCGPAAGPSEIRVLETGEVLRSASR